MISLIRKRLLRRLIFLAFPLALCLVVIFPALASAHAILLRSDPAKDAILSSSPSEVKMWFSEDLNPTFSTAVVVNATNQHVDKHDAHISPGDSREMIVSLPDNLPANVYVVVWRTQSANDGHVLTGSFQFSVALPDGTVPRLGPGSLPGQNALGSGNAVTTGSLDGPTFFSFLMVSLVDLCVVFWVGAQLWQSFVTQPDDSTSPRSGVEQQATRRFERLFALPSLLVLLLANVGVLVGQSLALTGEQWAQAFSPGLLIGLISSSLFGTFWMIRELVIFLALLLAAYAYWKPQRSRSLDSMLSWGNLILGLALLIAVTLSGHAAAVSSDWQVFAVLGDWLHLLAASLWVGGMLYLALVFLPVLPVGSLLERTRALLTTAPRFTPLAVAGVILMAVTGPFNAVVHMDSFSQLFTTAYGRALLVKDVFVLALLVTSAIHVFHFRPRLSRNFEHYQTLRNETDEVAEDQQVRRSMAQESKALEVRVRKQSHQLSRVLRWEPLLGVAVILCTGLMNVFAGTLLPAVSQPPVQQQQQAKPFNTTVNTKDNKFTIKLNVSPNRFGTNVFTVSVLDSNGKPDTNLGVSIYTTMVEMDMGTNTVNLQPDGKGHFSADGDLNMSGHWMLRIQIRTPENTLHEANTELYTPF